MVTRYNLRLHLEKDTFKFSCAHFTIFNATSKEPLHGHNYRVSLSIGLRDEAFVDIVNFVDVKAILKRLCDDWDERILIPQASDYVEASERDTSIDVVACGKTYSFPRDETILLDLPNITAECLAKELADRLVSAIRRKSVPSFLHIHEVEVRVDETDGQGASVRVAF